MPMSASQLPNSTVGACFPLPIMGLASHRSTPSEFSRFSSGFTAATSTRVAALAWQSANALSSSTGAAFGWSNLLPEADPPSASPCPCASSATSERAEPSGKPIVLILEDNPRDVFVIRYVLDSCGLDIDIRTVVDGDEALRYLQAVNQDLSLPCPALVLLDLNVPKVNGFRVLEYLRDESRCDKTLVVVVTSSGAELDRSTAELLRADAYFQKPMDLTAFMELAEVVRRVLHLSPKGGEQ